MTLQRSYRITRPIDGLAVGDVVTFVDTVDHLDWFQCLVSVDGQLRRVGFGLAHFCEEVK